MIGTLALVTGGAGFIGSNLVDRLLEEGARVRVVDDLSTGRLENLAGVRDRIEFVEGTITDPATCAEVCAGATWVFHQAAVPSVQRSIADPIRTHAVGATGTLNLLIAARAAGVKRFVYGGSSSAYGDTPTLPKREDMAERPLSPYAVAKLAGEAYARSFHHVHGFEAVVLRYFNVFGPRQDPTSQYSAVIPQFILAATEGRSPRINGDGEQTRDFTYVDNVVHANLLAARASAAAAGKVFNVGAGERVSINRLWEMISGIVGSAARPTYGPGRPGDVRDSLADLNQARAVLGYRVQVSLAEGLRRTAATLGALR